MPVYVGFFSIRFPGSKRPRRVKFDVSAKSAEDALPLAWSVYVATKWPNVPAELCDSDIWQVTEGSILAAGYQKPAPVAEVKFTPPQPGFFHKAVRERLTPVNDSPPDLTGENLAHTLAPEETRAEGSQPLGTSRE